METTKSWWMVGGALVLGMVIGAWAWGGAEPTPAKADVTKKAEKPTTLDLVKYEGRISEVKARLAHIDAQYERCRAVDKSWEDAEAEWYHDRKEAGLKTTEDDVRDWRAKRVRRAELISNWMKLVQETRRSLEHLTHSAPENQAEVQERTGKLDALLFKLLPIPGIEESN